MSRRTRPGFKLIELVIVIAILGAFAGLIIPAVLKIRAAEARTRTNNNLRQCALAIHSYHGDFNKLPNAAWNGGIYKDDDARRSMWFHLLPYVEQKIAYDGNVHDAVVPAYLAPSDPSLGDPAGRVCFAGNIRIFAYNTLTSTKANNLVDGAGKPTGITLRTDLAGAMSSGLTLARIPCGTSNVFMLATRYAECGEPSQTTYYSASPIGTVLADGVAKEGAARSTGVPTGRVKGAFFGAGAHNHLPDAISPNAMFQLAPTPSQCIADNSVFGHSFSTGALSTALADASIKNIDPNMNPETFCRALGPSTCGFACCGNDWPDQ